MVQGVHDIAYVYDNPNPRERVETQRSLHKSSGVLPQHFLEQTSESEIKNESMSLTLFTAVYSTLSYG